ncbi:hypothetical protein LR48_Vigan10g274400 [Vigna angularis]|uniref:F-box domain-containing protein n=1 Tax=Phaseolus angularis TaxID=3914 RepID=A0A0L9VPM2_PHAAN|nr:hypothetical protein LR48_Vigan10g274400 [Vigna angularis]
MADLISSLPNEIICYILSFLPSQQVVATSVLSKRWNLLWRSVPSFDFDNINELFWHSFEEKTFYRSVDYFLLLHGDQPLHKFRLRFIIQPLYIFPLKSEIIYYYLTERLNIWIKDAVSGSSKLQHLDLYLNSNNVLPSVVFSCKTLVVLKLAYTTVKDIFVVDLPLLKILHLNYVYSSKKDDFCQLLSGIPNLEVLEVRDTRLINEGKFKECP